MTKEGIYIIYIRFNIWHTDIYMMWCVCAQLCLTLQPKDYNLQGSSVHGIFQVGILDWVVSYSRGSYQPKDLTCISSLPPVPPGEPSSFLDDAKFPFKMHIDYCSDKQCMAVPITPCPHPISVGQTCSFCQSTRLVRDGMALLPNPPFFLINEMSLLTTGFPVLWIGTSHPSHIFF